MPVHPVMLNGGGSIVSFAVKTTAGELDEVSSFICFLPLVAVLRILLCFGYTLVRTYPANTTVTSVIHDELFIHTTLKQAGCISDSKRVIRLESSCAARIRLIVMQ